MLEIRLSFRNVYVVFGYSSTYNTWMHAHAVDVSSAERFVQLLSNPLILNRTTIC